MRAQLDHEGRIPARRASAISKRSQFIPAAGRSLLSAINFVFKLGEATLNANGYHGGKAYAIHAGVQLWDRVCKNRNPLQGSNREKRPAEELFG